MKGKNKSIQSRQTSTVTKTAAQAVPPGYKRTEVGVIPEDWEVDTLASVTPRGMQHGIVDGPFGSNLKRIHYRTSGVPIITSGYVTEGVFRADEYLYVDKDKFKLERRSAVAAGDIVMAKIGARCGASAILPENHPIGILSGNALKITVDQSRHSTYFIWQLLWSRYQRGNIDAWKSVGAQPAISMPTLKKQLLPLPSLPEQRAIAEVLSDVDGLIETLDKLVAKKRAIKQATMQQLLTGKTRLLGFSGEWKELNLARDSVLKARIGWQGLTTAEYRNSGNYYLVTGTDFIGGRVDWSKCYFVDYYRYIQDKNIQLSPEDVLLTKDGTIGKAAYVDKMPGPATLNSGIFVIRPKDNAYIPLYMYYVLTSEIFHDFLSRLQAGSTITHLYQKDFVNFTFEAPPLKEQRAIAQILSDMDAKIETLERRRDKVKRIKQGMMQQLLTGRIRLVKPQTTAAKTDEGLHKAKGHSWAFNEAVVISTLAKHFGSKRHPLGRKRYTKLSYLLHRYAEKNVEGYLKKAAGPYNPKTKYGGPEKIALEKGYIRKHKSGRYTGFVATKNITQAEDYFERWYGLENLQWLEQFRFKKNDELELLTTVDMAVEELRASGKDVDVKGVKGLIRSHPEWKAKLDRPIFSDTNIARAIKMLRKLFEASEE